MIKRIVSWIITLAILGLGGSILYRQLPCRVPVSYSIGAVDPRFGVSTESFRQAVRSAVLLWEEAEGRTLFEEVGTGGMVISAVYDQRQATRNRLEELTSSLDSSERTYATLRPQYDAARARYDQIVKELGVLRSSYDQSRETYDADVRAVQARGATPGDASRLETERLAVNALVDQLNAKQADMRIAAKVVNALVPALQQLAQQEHQSLEEYNRVGETIGSEFEAGIYAQERGERSITVSSFSDLPELTRLLTHELGHAIGLPHIDDSTAVMFRLNQSGVLVLSPSDLALLHERCSLYPGVWLMLKDRFGLGV